MSETDLRIPLVCKVNYMRKTIPITEAQAICLMFSAYTELKCQFIFQNVDDFTFKNILLKTEMSLMVLNSFLEQHGVPKVEDILWVK